MNEMQVIRVRYWAAARAAAGVAEEEIPVEGVRTLADLLAQLVRRHRSSRLPDVLAVCSVLVGDRPASSVDPASVVVRAGDTVDYLPPFAGG